MPNLDHQPMGVLTPEERSDYGMSLETKILWAQKRIREWLEAWNGECYVAFSGGKDSTVLRLGHKEGRKCRQPQ